MVDVPDRVSERRPAASICIANYNYAAYVGAAVDSALAQTYSPVEVIVVDDGSTDGSRDVLYAYGDDIRLVEQANAGQIAATDRAFAAATGDVVMFLDADDTLDPTAVERVVAEFTPGVAKVHFRLQVVDSAGRPTGVFPHRLLAMDAGDLRRQLCAEGDYVGPVTSGNAYTRAALLNVLPLGRGALGDLVDGAGSDGFLNSMTPFFGEVRSVEEVLGSYRSHGANHSAASGTLPLDFLAWRVDHELRREREIRRLAAAQGLAVRPDVMCANPEHVLARLLCLRLLGPAGPVALDTRPYLVWRLLTRSCRSHLVPGARRWFLVGAGLLAAVLPNGTLPQLGSWTLTSRPRPALLRLLSGRRRR